MSFNVLVIPEDFLKDQYVLKPIVEKMLQPIFGKPRVRVCTRPRLRGIAQALDWDHLKEIIDDYGEVDLFLLLVDRDGKVGRRASLDNLEQKARAYLGRPDKWLLGEHAWQEVEVWVLAGMQDLPREWEWQAIRNEIDPKEAYYLPYAEQRGLCDAPYQGRKTLAVEAASHYSRIKQLCPEDIGALESRLRELVGPSRA